MFRWAKRLARLENLINHQQEKMADQATAVSLLEDRLEALNTITTDPSLSTGLTYRLDDMTLRIGELAERITALDRHYGPGDDHIATNETLAAQARQLEDVCESVRFIEEERGKLRITLAKLEAQLAFQSADTAKLVAGLLDHFGVGSPQS